MKLLALIQQNLKTILALAVVVLLILIFWKPCNKDSEEVAKLKSEKTALQKEKDKATDSITAIRKQYKDDSTDARGREQLAEQEKQEADNKVKQQQRTIDRLAATIRQSNNTPIDTVTAVLVSRDYKDACDSFPPENDKLRAQLAEKDTAIAEWSDILAYEVQIRDAALEKEKEYSKKMERINEGLEQIAADAINRAKPRGRLLGGVGLIGNETNPLSGTKINLAYQSKGGKQYQVGGLLLRGAVYYEATVLITLIK